jgi:histone-lysine N-methyltransferase SETMAR
VPHPPYSPDLTPADFFLFPNLKTTLKGRRFQTIGEIQENDIRELRAITESAFQEAFQQWKKCCERCIAGRGDYFEGNSAYNAVK